MKICVELFRHSWSTKASNRKTCYAIGWAFYKKRFYDASQLCELLMSFSSTELHEYGEFACQLNGNFLIIIEKEEKAMVISDRLRSYSALYFKYNGNIYITDDINKLLDKRNVKLSINEDSVEQYLLSNFVFGKNTVYERVHAIQAGEVISWEKPSFKTCRYFVWEPDLFNEEIKDIEAEAAKLDAIFLSAFKRMIQSAPEVDRWIVPLSGGHDSRLIVNYLYRLGIKNVVCYSYGIKGNLQSVISEQVAKALGYQWVFIEYDDQSVQDLQVTGLIEDYIGFAFNGTSTPHLQDFLATYFLKKMNILRENDFFVPGHSFDFFCGSHLTPFMLKCRNTDDILKTISRHYSTWSYIPRSKNVLTNIKSLVSDYPMKPESFADFFNWQERQTKFIVNSVRCYEFFGYQWRIPLWDNEFFLYWKNIGFQYRYKRRMFLTIDRLFLLTKELRSISFSDDAVNLKGKKKDILNRLIPTQIKVWLYKLGYKPGGDSYFVIEGSHKMFSKESGELKQYTQDGILPKSITRYIFPGNRALKYCEINSLVTLKVIYALFSRNKIEIQ